jgi:hypothetical protein
MQTHTENKSVSKTYSLVPNLLIAVNPLTGKRFARVSINYESSEGTSGLDEVFISEEDFDTFYSEYKSDEYLLKLVKPEIDVVEGDVLNSVV